MEKNIDEIISGVKPNWSDDLIIRYLYIKLAPCFKRDLKFFLADDDEKLRQYNQGFINRFPNVVCSTLADFYVDLYNDFGINARKEIATSSKIPLFSVLVNGEKGLYFLDPLADLFSNQYGLRPYFFGVKPRYKTINNKFPELVNLDKDYVSYLDETLEIPEFLDEMFLDLHNNLTDRNKAYDYFGISKIRNERVDLREKKLQLYNDEFINLGEVDGYFERAQMYKYLNDKLLNRTEKKYVCVMIKGEFENPYISYEVMNKNGNVLYHEEKKDNKFVLVKK